MIALSLFDSHLKSCSRPSLFPLWFGYSSLFAPPSLQDLMFLTAVPPFYLINRHFVSCLPLASAGVPVLFFPDVPPFFLSSFFRAWVLGTWSLLTRLTSALATAALNLRWSSLYPLVLAPCGVASPTCRFLDNGAYRLARVFPPPLCAS